jgi:hypothetical protein
MTFQSAGGIAHLMYYSLESEDNLAPLEALLLQRFEERSGRLPPWNRTRRRKGLLDDQDLIALANGILDKLGV